MSFVKHTLKVIAICLAVIALLLLRKPPKTGDAAITGIQEELQQRVLTEHGLKGEVLPERFSKPKEDLVPRAEEASAGGQVHQSQPAIRMAGQPLEETGAAETSRASVTAERQVGAQTPEMGMPVGVVDARNCVGLNYNQIMRGAVSTRMVWNGNTFVPQKVCVVKEGDSAASVWSFEQSSGAIVAEVREGFKAPSGSTEK
jgi:hypothetical protein